MIPLAPFPFLTSHVYIIFISACLVSDICCKHSSMSLCLVTYIICMSHIYYISFNIFCNLKQTWSPFLWILLCVLSTKSLGFVSLSLAFGFSRIDFGSVSLYSALGLANCVTLTLLDPASEISG